MADAVQEALPGLTAAEVAERVRRGQVNRTRRSHWAEYRAILFRNVLTVFNAIVVPAAVALFLLHEYRGAVAVSGFAIINSAIGLVQEVRAKWHLDRLTILVETRARVVRDGRPQEIPAGDVVLGDHIMVAAGEAVVADGTVLEAHFLEVDEALLTGESDPVRRQPGDHLLSGSFCVAGEGRYRADKVGGEAFAQSTSAEARRYQYKASPLQAAVDRIIEILTAVALVLCALYGLFYFLGDLSEKNLWEQIAATITSLVPQGLVLMATLAFTLGAVHMSSRGAVVQRLTAVESMAAVNVICTDKTGTLTTNRLQLDQVRVLGGRSEEEVREKLRRFAWASGDARSKSILALREALGKEAGPLELVDQLPFKSQNRYSAVRVRTGREEQVLVLGAWEALRDFLEGPGAGEWEPAWKELLPTGLRILLFAESGHRASFDGTLAGFLLRPLALVALSDQLRPEAGQVLEALAAQAIDFKILSGDNPDTVRATVAHLRLPLAREPVVAGDELGRAPDRDALILNRGVFGRVAPKQKVEIVRTLKEHGRHVAMIGDGVNDVLPLKQADLGIAMGEGSSAAKTVSGLVLEDNDFALLPETLEEGRAIVRKLRRAAKLFLLKDVYSFLLIIGTVLVFNLPFPYLPQQVTLLNALTIGIPALVVTLSRERSTAANRPGFVREVLWFAVRTGVIMGLAGLVMLLVSGPWLENLGTVRGPALHAVPGPLGAVFFLDHRGKVQRTLLLSLLILLGVTAVQRALTDGETAPPRPNVWLRWTVALAVPVYLLVMYLPPVGYAGSVPLSLAYYHELEPLSPADWGLVLAVAVPAYLLCRLSDRWA